MSGNGFALVATRGPIATLLDTVVTGARRILAGDDGTSADIDCASAGTSHPCRMNVSGVAAQAINGARATLIAAGDSPARSSPQAAERYRSSARARPAVLGTTPISSVASWRVLVTDDTIVQGAIQCTTAADAVLDATVIVAQGATITGCEHASTPLP